MIRVLYYDHTARISTDDITRLVTNLTKDPNIKLDFFKPVTTFNTDKEKLEKMLQKEDVLLIHPGLYGQKTVIEDYPKRFQKLKIAILSYWAKDYMNKNRKIKLLDYKNIKKIIKFVRSK